MRVRPRFKKLKKRGVNFLNSPRMRRRQTSINIEEKDIENDVEPVYNEQLLMSPTMKLTEDHGGRARRIKTVRSLIREHQNILKEIYGRDRRNHFGNKSRKSVVAKVKKNAEEFGDSRLNRFETRLDIVRLRSGLAVSPAQGSLIISMGLVTVSEIDWSEENNNFIKKSEKVIKSPNYRREKGMMVLQIKSKYHKQFVNILGEYLENENVHHIIPSYREVDHEKGTVVFLQIPKDGEVLRPKGCAVARSSRLNC